MRATILVLAVFDFLLFGAALRAVFAPVSRIPLVTRLMIIVGTVISCVHVSVLATAPLRVGNATGGIVLYCVACVLFCWASVSVKGKAFTLAYCPGCPPAVVSSGPYRWVRHPFYLSYTLAWLAVVIATADVRLLVTVAIMLGFYVGAAYGEERRMLRGPTADQYRAYRRHVGLLLPRL